MLTDPRLRKVQAAIGHVMQTAEDYNSPLVTGERIGSAGKPGSKPPGQQQCPWVTDRVAEIMERAVASATAALDAANPRERHSAVHSVGGREITVAPPLPNRRGPYRRRS